MKIFFALIVLMSFTGTLLASDYQTNYSTSRASGTIMIAGSGTYETDLNKDLRESFWRINTDAALFLFPQFAAGIEFGYGKDMHEELDDVAIPEDDPTVYETVSMTVGPRVFIFFGGKRSELTPFIKAGADYLIDKEFIDEKEQERNSKEMGLVTSAGLLLNLAKNVGMTVEAEYNFEKGTDVDEIDTKQLLIKFGIRSFLGE